MKVLILCGGKGERLRPFTDDIPKPLIEINNKPILGYVIDHILAFGIDEIIIAVGYRSNKIQEYIEDKYSSYKFIISDQGDVDIVERIRSVAQDVKSDMIVLYGDTISNVNLKTLKGFSLQHKEAITVTLWPMRSQFGVIETDSNDKVISYEEKPILDKWINIGYFYFKKKGLDLLKNIDTYEEFLNYIIKENELIGFKHRGDHITVNTLKELQEAQIKITKLYNLTEVGKNNGR
jgi:glucose-1-phosphate cytidylyltransferase